MAFLAETRERLLHVLDRQDTKRTRNARIERDAEDSPGCGLADVVVVRGLAADHRAETGDAGITTGLRAVLRRQRQLEGARHVVHVCLAEDAHRALDEPLCQI